MLGHLRFPVEQSRGRKYPEPDHPYRNAFQRDRDRVIHSRAFRRLEAKTQVFAPGLSDHFRNRLTHTIEVSQIARTVAGVLDLDENLTEALALAHDIGHPPFAHAGEEELNRQMHRFGERFDHNLHALRIVESFEQRYARFPGLNLTFEVREGIVKHSRDFGPGEDPALDGYLPGLRPVLEAQLIDLADEVAYNAGDLDDACSAGLIAPEDAAASVPQYGRIFEAVETQYPGATARERFHESLRGLIDFLVSGLIEGTVSAARASGAGTAVEVREFGTRLACFSPEAAIASRALKAFLLERVYATPALNSSRSQSQELIAGLFRLFVEDPARLPQAYAEHARAEPPHRVVCDYIAGMTDAFFYRTYEQVLGPVPTPQLS
ncbi:MAG TPA: dNTP triphosphohydrolase [Bryobacteraceae bacterium]|nr:dNTP triphosphohydrolase [Bryobacteraceae bacterium]HXK04373.1 dNTP triphosphohydrolase [Verrucomicrobiae bacterium]